MPDGGPVKQRLGVLLLAAVTAAFGGLVVETSEPAAGGQTLAAAGSSPVKHVIIILQENHSFDNLLGKFCAEVKSAAIQRGGADDPCDGVTTGKISTGQTVPLVSAPDFVPTASHSVVGQQEAIDDGKMDGFNTTNGCEGGPSLYDNCYNQYDPLSGPCESANGSCITNVAALATKYAVSDRTFELAATPSWAGHMVFATATMDGFKGDIPSSPSAHQDAPQPVAVGPGWGCDSGFSTPWGPNDALVPSCIPDSNGSLGPNWANYTGLKAPYVPTIFDELDAKGLTWRIYGGDGKPVTKTGFGGDGWAWAICPTFAQCLYSQQRNDLVPATDVVTDASGGDLPSFAIVTPTVANSQHNDDLMSEGDNWIGQVMSALMASPEWSSTAVFLTWDDCGCFYDHVNPLTYNATWGLRVPMIIVSPYAKPGYTDSHPTTFAGVLAYAEHTLGLAPLNSDDATAYDYSGAFCYDPAKAGCRQVGTALLHMARTGLTKLTAAQRRLSAESGEDDT